jgi:hypothetical protein
MLSVLSCWTVQYWPIRMRHLFDPVPDGLAEEFQLQRIDGGGYYVGQERQCYKEALVVTIEGIKLHMSKFDGKVRVYDNTKALMEFRKAMKECHNADPHNQWYKYMYGKVIKFGLTGLDKSTVERLHRKIVIWLCDCCYKISKRMGCEVLCVYPVMEGNWIVRQMGNGMWRVDGLIWAVFFHDHDCCELSYHSLTHQGANSCTCTQDFCACTHCPKTQESFT